MAELSQIVASLENRTGKLISRLAECQQENLRLKHKLNTLTEQYNDAMKNVEQWEEKYDSLKMAGSMVGSNNNTTEAKLKINRMIRELDHCIAQLSE